MAEEKKDQIAEAVADMADGAIERVGDIQDAAEESEEERRRRERDEEDAIFLGRDGLPTGEFQKLSPEEEKARKRRNVTIAWSLVAFMAVIFVVTVVRLQEAAMTGPVSPG